MSSGTTLWREDIVSFGSDRVVFVEGLGRLVFDALRYNSRYSTSHIGQLWSTTWLFDDIKGKGRGVILPNFAVERIHLLKRITLELSAIQRLHSQAGYG